MSDRSPASRIATIDLIRGIAVMGILAMNIVGFAMPAAAYFNPRAWGGWHGADLAAWVVAAVLFDGKMRALFSILFGTSMLLVADAAEARGASAAQIHYRRMAWLFVFGLAHMILVWDGDILNTYALVGMAAFPLRRAPVEKLAGMALVLILIQTLLYTSLAFDVVRVMAAVRTGSADAEAARTALGYRTDFGVPPATDLAREVALHRGAWWPLVVDRAREAGQTVIQPLAFVGFETAGYMLLGMAGLRTGFLSGALPRAVYRWTIVAGLLALAGYAAIAALEAHWRFSESAVALAELPLAAPLRPVATAGIAAAAILLIRPDGWFGRRIAAAGRMAFSNYLLTSLICTTLAYGYGFDLYGRLGRAMLYPIVLGVWAAMLLWSRPWLAHFRYGPLEWLWRSLARGRLQPLRGAAG